MQSLKVAVMINRARVGFQQFIDGFYKRLLFTKREQQNRVHQIKRLIYFRQNLLHQCVEEEEIHINDTIKKKCKQYEMIPTQTRSKDLPFFMGESYIQKEKE